MGLIPGRCRGVVALCNSVNTCSSSTDTGSQSPEWSGCSVKPTALFGVEMKKTSTSAVFTQQRLSTYLLTYSMVQSPSWEANWFAASQEIPRISRKPKVHYRTHKRPPPVSILGQPNPVHITTSHLLEIHPNIIHPSKPRPPQWSLSLRFPHQDPIHPPSPHPYAPHAQPISFFSILSPAQYWVSSTNHLAPRYAISSIPPLPRPS